MKCVDDGGFNITEGQFYQIIDENDRTGKVQVRDDDGALIWVPEHCFNK